MLLAQARTKGQDRPSRSCRVGVEGFELVGFRVVLLLTCPVVPFLWGWVPLHDASNKRVL